MITKQQVFRSMAWLVLAALIVILFFMIASIVYWVAILLTQWKHLWGDIASLLGLLIAIAGFTATIILTLRSKSAAETATKAARDAVAAVVHFDCLTELTKTQADLQQIADLYLSKDWEQLPPRFANIRSRLVAIRAPASTLPEPLKVQVAGIALLLKDIDNDVAEFFINLKKREAPIRYRKHLEIVKEQLDVIAELQIQLKLSGGHHG